VHQRPIHLDHKRQIPFSFDDRKSVQLAEFVQRSYQIVTKGLAWTAAAQFANMALKPFPIPDEWDDALSILDTTSGSFTAAGSLMTMKSVEPLHKLLHNWLFSWGTDASLVTTPVPTSLAQDTLPSYLEQEPVPRSTRYHLTARPWHPLGSEK